LEEKERQALGKDGPDSTSHAGIVSFCDSLTTPLYVYTMDIQRCYANTSSSGAARFNPEAIRRVQEG
jgi:hypothetical protein